MFFTHKQMALLGYYFFNMAYSQEELTIIAEAVYALVELGDPVTDELAVSFVKGAFQEGSLKILVEEKDLNYFVRKCLYWAMKAQENTK